VAALELALILPFMVLLLMGMFDFANVAYYTMQVNAAAYAGVHAAVAAVQSGGSCTTSVITSAEVSATSLGSKVSTSGTGAGQAPNCSYSGYVNTTQSNGKTTNILVPNAASCTGTCTGPGAYAVAYAQASYTPLLSWSALVLPSTISATAMVRYG
jgi:Flp pilus assembly protein TadG